MTNDNLGRRWFLKTAGAAGVFTILKPHLLRGSQANSAVRVGLVGCGRRGSTVAGKMLQHTGARLVALGDLFPDQIEKARQRFKDAALTFTGPAACEQLATSKEVDAVIVATPAYFHPDHLATVVAAGKHVYLEKPVGVDVAGAMRVLEIAKKAEGRLSLEVGFQIRCAPPFVELVKRIHAGALGRIVSGAAHYYCPAPESREWPGESGAKLRVRNWIQDRVLSGDTIVEQAIHAIDICNWVLKSHPLKAVGKGGPAGRAGVMPYSGDDCYSHFDLVFEYPEQVHIGFNSCQFGKGPFEVNERFFGTRGASQSPYSGMLGVAGEESWKWEGSDKTRTGEFAANGAFSDNLAQADSEKQKSFIASITTGQFHNQAAGGVESALSAMLGRRAAYTGREVTWDELLKSRERWNSKIDLNKLA